MATPVSSKTNRATLKGLLPDWPYAIEVSSDGGKSWSKALKFRTTADRTPPPVPTGLTVTVVGSSFVLKWNNNAETADDFKDYEITVYPTGSPAQAITETRTSNSYEFSIYQNRHFFGTPQGSLTFEVRSRDLTYNRSDPVTGSATTTAPVGFTITAEGGPRAIKIAWTNQGVTTHYRVYRSASQPVATTTPIGTVVTESAEGDAVSYWDIPGDNNVYWYKVIAVDAFGNTSESDEASAAAEGGLDDTVPTDPVAPTVVGGVHSFTITQPVAAAETQTRFVHVYASPTSPFVADESTFVGSVTVPRGATSVEDTFVWVVDGPAVDVFVKTTLATKDGFASIASPEAKAAPPVSNITEDNTTYIQELSASKLKANTAINKNLTVAALLKMGTGGIIESTPYTEDAAGKPTAGWRLTDTTLKMKGAGVFSGTIEADAGWLTNLTVRGNITVGETGYTGAIQSGGANAYSPGTGSIAGTGWKISNDGTAEFNNATVRGYLGADEGYLKNLNVTGQLTMNGGYIYGYYGTNRYYTLDQYGLKLYNGSTTPAVDISTTGSAIFRGTIYAAAGEFQGNITGASGTFSGNLSANYVSGTLGMNTASIDMRSGGTGMLLSGSSSEITYYSGGSVFGRIRFDTSVTPRRLYVDAFAGMSASLHLWGDYIDISAAFGYITMDAGNYDVRIMKGGYTYTAMHSGNYSSWAAPKSHNHGSFTTGYPSDNETSGRGSTGWTYSNTGGASAGTAHTHQYVDNHIHYMKNHTHTVSI